MRTKRLLAAAAAREATKNEGSAADSAIVVAALTAMAYVVAYAYEAGYCAYFRIPVQLISPTATVLVGAVLGVGLFAMGIAPLVGLLRLAWRKANLTDLAIVRIELALLLSFVVLSVVGLTWLGAGLVLFCIFLTCGDYLPAFWRRGSLRERLELIESAPDPAYDHNPVSSALRRLKDRRIALSFAFAYLSFVAAGGLGAFNARTQSEFQVISSRPDLALVRAYGDLLIAVKFDEAKKAATGEVVIFKVGDEFKELHVFSKRIGPLAKSEVLRN